MSNLFDEKAESWDADDLIKKLSSAVGASMLEHVPFHEQMDVMDFGAGTGLISSHVAPLVHKIVAVDISRAMLDKLALKPELQGKVEAVCQDVMDSPLGVQFDSIISAMALHHIEDTHKAVRMLSGHLKPGGILALADLDSEEGDFHPQDTEGVFHFGFEREQLRQILVQSGFESVTFFTAHTINKNGKEYPVFLVVAIKHRLA